MKMDTPNYLMHPTEDVAFMDGYQPLPGKAANKL
jgi:hypothetical protein